MMINDSPAFIEDRTLGAIPANNTVPCTEESESQHPQTTETPPPTTTDRSIQTDRTTTTTAAAMAGTEASASHPPPVAPIRPTKPSCAVIERINATTTTTTTTTENEHDCRFHCNICLEPASDPVVTRCGHLYCWSCLYRWLRPGIQDHEYSSLVDVDGAEGWDRGRLWAGGYDASRRVCPVCKAECTIAGLVPIYVRALPDVEKAAGGKRKMEEMWTDLDDSDDADNHDDDAAVSPEETQDIGVATTTTTTGLRRRRISSAAAPTTSPPTTNAANTNHDNGASSPPVPPPTTPSHVPLRPMPPPPLPSTTTPITTITNNHNQTSSTPSTQDILYRTGLYIDQELRTAANAVPPQGSSGTSSQSSSLHQSQSLFQALLGMQVHATNIQPHSPTNSYDDDRNIPPIHHHHGRSGGVVGGGGVGGNGASAGGSGVRTGGGIDSRGAGGREGASRAFARSPERHRMGSGGGVGVIGRQRSDGDGSGGGGLGLGQVRGRSSSSSSTASYIPGSMEGREEGAAMDYLSRLLAMLFLFVVLCLLLF